MREKHILIEDRQSRSRVVVTGTPKVAYRYENGSANNVRLNRITYPDSKLLNLLFGTSGQQDDLLSRVKQLQWDGTVVTDYTYLGPDRRVVVDYPQPTLKWNIITGTANDPAQLRRTKWARANYEFMLRHGLAKWGLFVVGLGLLLLILWFVFIR